MGDWTIQYSEAPLGLAVHGVIEIVDDSQPALEAELKNTEYVMNWSYSFSVVQLTILEIPGGPVHGMLLFTDQRGNAECDNRSKDRDRRDTTAEYYLRPLDEQQQLRRERRLTKHGYSATEQQRDRNQFVGV
jgi:hypothetical protein